TSLELLRSVHDHWMHTEDRHVHRAGAVHPGAASGDFLQQDRRLGDAEAVTPVLLGSGDAEPSALRERVVELGRKFVTLILGHPIVVIEFAGQLGNRRADRLLILAQFEVHTASTQPNRGWITRPMLESYQRSDQN